MALVTINNRAVIAGTIAMPLVGVWTADLVVDQLDASGFTDGSSVTIQTADSSFKLQGTVQPDRNGVFLDTVHIRVLGGKAGMAKSVTPRFFKAPSAFARDVFNAVLGDGGESLSATADQGLVNTNLSMWTLISGTVSKSIKLLINKLNPDANWRILADGTFWVGSESWSSTSGNYQIIEQDPKNGTFVLGVDQPFLVPGTTLDGVGQINRVEHRIQKDKVRSMVWINL